MHCNIVVLDIEVAVDLIEAGVVETKRLLWDLEGWCQLGLPPRCGKAAPTSAPPMHWQCLAHCTRLNCIAQLFNCFALLMPQFTLHSGGSTVGKMCTVGKKGNCMMHLQFICISALVVTLLKEKTIIQTQIITLCPLSIFTAPHEFICRQSACMHIFALNISNCALSILIQGPNARKAWSQFCQPQSRMLTAQINSETVSSNSRVVNIALLLHLDRPTTFTQTSAFGRPLERNNESVVRRRERLHPATSIRELGAIAIWEDSLCKRFLTLEEQFETFVYSLRGCLTTDTNTEIFHFSFQPSARASKSGQERREDPSREFRGQVLGTSAVMLGLPLLIIMQLLPLRK